ncbi:glycosyltransferase family 2 protein [Lusitaniella coriacea LEGE 07157]|uniref:Glycosyltransferase family 2 protein n=1 Tax=Lusitaniella coriacea LEGE 07157 TaxID=945747 RepID=A0A8J7E3K2_9CYAN|nr:hormogonium polysaccharide biosynthesis glycosyltransferase HpsE [Lusitaniella coriacea]MBE9118064.1 glycosyltransferase family 2 protein [Lusitaniella coriacea LEGE 07157]
MVDFTVAIPTYNGASRIPPLLERLREQTNTENFSWEIIVVDNNSTDNTKEVVENYQENWSNICTLKYAFQPKQGLAFTRQRAIQVASADKWIGFLDDDVIPAADWVEKAYAFAQTHPEVGAYGGQIHGAFEVDPPENFKRIQSFLAIRERGEKPHPYQPDLLSLPPGAALVVDKEAWNENKSLFGRDLKNNVMLAGEDYEILLGMHRAGKEIWYNPTMHVHHQIPKKRLEKEYLIPLIRGCGSCVCYLHFVSAKTWEKPWIMTKIFLGSLRRAVKHRLKYGEQIKTNLIAACEMEFFMSSALSPFFLLKRTFQGYSEKINLRPKTAGLELKKN